MVWVIELNVTCSAIEDEGAGAGVIVEAGRERVLTVSVHGESLDDPLPLEVPGRDDRQSWGGRKGGREG